ncbi:MAG: alpha-amylase family glycosyl hydrolase [Patescibacteria group bacterium]
MNKHWSRNAVVYQIYPLSFKDSNGDGQGDLAGIVEKLDYLQKLGVDAIWICPFFRSPMVDFGYDVEDYKDVDPVFGDLKIFERLVYEAKKRKIKVLVDFVGNHTAATHKWFIESRSSRENSKRDWYIWHDGDAKGGSPNNWLSVFGGSAWQFDKTTDQYYLHTFLKEQPDLNWHNPEVRAEMMSVIDFWVDQGVDGFRVDALQHFLEDEKLRDEKRNPTFHKETDEPYKALVHRFSLSGELSSSNKRANIIGTFLNEALEKHPDLFIVGEVYVGLEELTKVYDLCPNGRFMPFNFNLIGTPWIVSEYKKIIDEYQSKLKPSHLPNFVFGNHDVARLASRLGETKARLVAFLELTLPGMPFIYYGDEIGMTNGSIPENAVKDVLAKIFPGLQPGRDMERTPMQWDDSTNTGFTDGKPWLPVAENFKKINVQNEEQEENSTLSLYKNLIRIRKSSEALHLGEYTPCHSNSPSVFSFERHFGNERLLVLVNFGQNIEREILPVTVGQNNGRISDTHTKIIFSTSRGGSTYQNLKTVELMPYEACIVRL